jgi:hypothetical protein
MDYLFRLDLGAYSPEQLAVLHDIGAVAHVSGRSLSDEQFVRMQWFIKHGEALDLERPRTFSEKIQWLKLYARDPQLPQLVDKLEVRDWVAARAGEQVLNELYWAGDAEQLRALDPATLPAQFIVKCTHGCGWNIAVPDRDAADWPAIVDRTCWWLSTNYSDLYREWVYREIPPRVTIERLLDASGPHGLCDYKFYCYDGEPQHIQVDLGRPAPLHDPPPAERPQQRAFYDPDWQRIPCALRYPAPDADLPRPDALPEMLTVARQLSAGFAFVRVDLYAPAAAPIFGELTFYPGNGLQTFTPDAYDRAFGDHLQLPTRDHAT